MSKMALFAQDLIIQVSTISNDVVEAGKHTAAGDNDAARECWVRASSSLGAVAMKCHELGNKAIRVANKIDAERAFRLVNRYPDLDSSCGP